MLLIYLKTQQDFLTREQINSALQKYLMDLWTYHYVSWLRGLWFPPRAL